MMCSSRVRAPDIGAEPSSEVLNPKPLPEVSLPVVLELNMSVDEVLKSVKTACKSCSYVDPSRSGHAWQRVRPGAFGDQCYTLEVSATVRPQPDALSNPEAASRPSTHTFSIHTGGDAHDCSERRRLAGDAQLHDHFHPTRASH